MTVPPGWYADPADPTTQRYWDGDGWLGRALPVDATPPAGPLPDEPPAAPPAPGPTGTPPFAGTPEATGPAAAPIGRPLPPPVAPPGAGQPGMPPGPPYPHPYAAPPPRPHGLALAGFGARLVARLIDFGIILVLSLAANAVFIWRLIQDLTPLMREVLRRRMAGDLSQAGLPQPENTGNLLLAILLTATALWFAYEVPALANRGQTFGKRVVGIKVVALGEDPTIGFGRSLRRWNTFGLPTLLWYCWGFGLVLQLIDALSPLVDHPLWQALHDKRAQTVVVRLPARPAPGQTAPPAQTAPPTQVSAHHPNSPGDAE